METTNPDHVARHTVVAVAPDLFFASRLRSVVERAGSTIAFATGPSDLPGLIRQLRPALVLVDLAARGLDSAATVHAAKGAGASRVLAFGPHKDLAARAAALEAGADQWITNQRLLDVLSGELRRLG